MFPTLEEQLNSFLSILSMSLPGPLPPNLSIFFSEMARALWIFWFDPVAKSHLFFKSLLSFLFGS